MVVVQGEHYVKRQMCLLPVLRWIICLSVRALLSNLHLLRHHRRRQTPDVSETGLSYLVGSISSNVLFVLLCSFISVLT